MKEEALILNIESSTEVCSISLSKGNELIGLKETDEPRSHSGLITVFIEDVMNDAPFDIKELSAVSVSIGPGSYTGLRVGLSAAKGICYVNDIPLIGLDSLDVIAQHNLHLLDKDAVIIPMIDARRMEVYTKILDPDLKTLEQTHAHIITDESFKAFRTKSWLICGNGAQKTIETLQMDDLKLGIHNTSASAMVTLANKKYIDQDFTDVVYSSPHYLKNPNITKAKSFL